MKIFKKNIYIIGNSPQTDWQRVFIVTIILILTVSIYGIIFYKGIEAQSIDKETPITATAKANAEKKTEAKADSNPVPEGKVKLELGQIIDLYSSKKAKYDKFYKGLN